MIFDAFIIKYIDFEIVQIKFLGDYFELINECIRLFCWFYFIIRELKQQTFLIHGRLPEVKFQALHLLRMPSRF